jgi:hypothetical protein
MKFSRHSTRLFVCMVAVTLAIAGIAFATPIVGLLTSVILANGNTTTSDILVRSHVALPPAPGQEPGDDDSNEWSGLILLHGPTNVQVQSFSFDVNGHTG